MIRVNHKFEEQIHQGDVIRNFSYIQKIEPLDLDKNKFKINMIEFPLVIVLTQECDLELDYKARKGLIMGYPYPQDMMLMSALVSPIYNAEQVFIGNHLEEIDNRQMQTIHSGIEERIRISEVPRYYLLNFHPDENTNDLIIDFKHYFSVDVGTLEELKANNFQFSILEPYREDISLKFANYLARIGLP